MHVLMFFKYVICLQIDDVIVAPSYSLDFIDRKDRMNRVVRIDLADGQHLRPVDAVAIPNNAFSPHPSRCRMFFHQRCRMLSSKMVCSLEVLLYQAPEQGIEPLLSPPLSRPGADRRSKLYSDDLVLVGSKAEDFLVEQALLEGHQERWSVCK